MIYETALYLLSTNKAFYSVVQSGRQLHHSTSCSNGSRISTTQLIYVRIAARSVVRQKFHPPPIHGLSIAAFCAQALCVSLSALQYITAHLRPPCTMPAPEKLFFARGYVQMFFFEPDRPGSKGQRRVRGRPRVAAAVPNPLPSHPPRRRRAGRPGKASGQGCRQGGRCRPRSHAQGDRGATRALKKLVWLVSRGTADDSERRGR